MTDAEKNEIARRLYASAYYADHKAAILDRKKSYYRKHRKDIIARQRTYYQQHRARILESKRRYYQANRHVILLWQHDYRHRSTVQGMSTTERGR